MFFQTARSKSNIISSTKRHFSEQVKQSDDFEGQFYVYTLLWVISCACTQGDREKATLVCQRRYLPFVYLSSELNGKWAISTWNFSLVDTFEANP